MQLQLLAGIWLTLLLMSCAQSRVDHSAMIIVPDVPPFAAQSRSDDCGSVALASLLQHAGIKIAPEEIDRHIYDPQLRGSLLADMEDFAAARRLTPHTGRGNLAFLRQQLNEMVPVLLPIDLGWGIWRRPHYVVVFGFGPDSFLLHKRHEDTMQMSATELNNRWSKMGYLYLYLNPPR